MDNTHTLKACVDCGFFLANGEPENPDAGWSPDKIERNWPAADWHLVNGDSDDDSEFSRSACHCCGSTLGGARMAVVAIPRTAYKP